MEGGKQIIAVLVLLVVIVVAVVLLTKNRASSSGPSSEILSKPIEMIDKESLELMTLSAGEWKDLGSKNRAYKNPETGKYNMVGPRICASCGAKIPGPDVPEGASQEEGMKIAAEYMCPKCGQRAFLDEQPE